jgi:hypothetical protein
MHSTLNEETLGLILIDRHEIEALLESHIACFADVIFEALIADP